MHGLTYIKKIMLFLLVLGTLDTEQPMWLRIGFSLKGLVQNKAETLVLSYFHFSQFFQLVMVLVSREFHKTTDARKCVWDQAERSEHFTILFKVDALVRFVERNFASLRCGCLCCTRNC